MLILIERYIESDINKFMKDEIGYLIDDSAYMCSKIYHY